VVALARRLPRDGDITLDEVAQPAVHELRAPAARARREVDALDEGGAQASRCGIEHDSGPGDAAADDDDVVGGAGQAVEGGRPRGCVDGGGHLAP
jgi:hypothetical protein